MVSTALAAAGGAFAGSIVTGIVSYYNTRLQQERQDTRERAGFYIERKVEILTNLHERITECHSLLTPYVTHDDVNVETDELNQPIAEAQFEKANNLTREIRTLILKAQLYLTDEQKTELQVALMSINYALSEVGYESTEFETKPLEGYQKEAEATLSEFTEEIELSDYYENVYMALNLIKEEVNEPIEELRQ